MPEQSQNHTTLGETGRNHPKAISLSAKQPRTTPNPILVMVSWRCQINIKLILLSKKQGTTAYRNMPEQSQNHITLGETGRNHPKAISLSAKQPRTTPNPILVMVSWRYRPD
jgi:hypothetical protein